MTKRYSKISWKLLSASLILALLPLLIYFDILASEVEYTTGQLIASWLLFVFFTIGVISMIGLALPKFNYLKLNETGFQIRHGFANIESTWNNCKEISITEMKVGSKMHKWVEVTLLETVKSSLLFKSSTAWRHIFMFAFGLSTQQLFDILTEYHKKYAPNGSW